jgi:uncharacterized protein (DUF2267 family)
MLWKSIATSGEALTRNAVETQWPACCTSARRSSEHQMKNPQTIESLERTIERTNEWLVELSLLLGSDDGGDCYAALRSVLHALRDRLPIIAGVRLGAQLPTLLRGVYYEGWQPDRGHVHTRTLGEFLALVERDAPHGGTASAEDKARAVFMLLGSHVEPAELDRVVGALPDPVRQLFPSARKGMASASPRSSIRHAPPSAKSA